MTIRECGTRRCPFCHRVQRDEKGRILRVHDAPRALTDADLRWWLRDAQAALGIRSAFGSAFSYRLASDAKTKESKLELVFCPSGGGGGNSAERSWESQRKREAAARERCISQRLRGAAPAALAALVACYSPPTLAVRAERLTGERDARLALTEQFGELLALVPLTASGQRELLPAAVLAAAPPSTDEYHVAAGDMRLAVRLRRRSGEEIYDVTETDESLRCRSIGAGGGVLTEEHQHLYLPHLGGVRLEWAAAEVGIERHSYQMRRWSGGAQDGALARLATLAQAAERGKKRHAAAQGRHRQLKKDEQADHRAWLAALRMRDEAQALLDEAHVLLDVQRHQPEPAEPAPKAPRPKAPPRPPVARVQAMLPGGA